MRAGCDYGPTIPRGGRGTGPTVVRGHGRGGQALATPSADREAAVAEAGARGGERTRGRIWPDRAARHAWAPGSRRAGQAGAQVVARRAEAAVRHLAAVGTHGARVASIRTRARRGRGAAAVDVQRQVWRARANAGSGGTHKRPAANNIGWGRAYPLERLVQSGLTACSSRRHRSSRSSRGSG